MLYGAGAWTPTRTDLQKVKSMHVGMCRKILGAKRHSEEEAYAFNSRTHRRVQNIWLSAGILSWDRQVLRSLYSWAGSVARRGRDTACAWPSLLSRWRDSEYLAQTRAFSRDGRRLNRGHRRKPWRWETPFLQFYQTNCLIEFPVWRQTAYSIPAWVSNCDSWVSWWLL